MATCLNNCWLNICNIYKKYIMPNVVRNDEHLKDESKQNNNENIPVKNKATDDVKSTAEEIGLNQERVEKNDLEPGTEIADDE